MIPSRYHCRRVFDLAVQLALHGNDRLEAGDFSQAIKWYERAQQQGNVPVWVYYNAARVYARIGLTVRALSCLQKALEVGLNDFERMRNDADFACLRCW
jgi:tetratricopeptide (TPR) repeat protein